MDAETLRVKFAEPSTAPAARVEIRAPSRLHITLIDMHGAFSGRVDGGVGISLREPSVEISIQPSRTGFIVTCANGDPADRDEAEGEVLSVLRRMSQQIGLAACEVSISSPL